MATAAAPVSVRYRCPCTACFDTEAAAAPEQQPAGSDDASAADVPAGDAGPQALGALHTWPIEALYYCDDCSEVRCPQCVVEEPAGYHCPNCLFDVPTASVRSEHNCCARNCFQCPVCTQVLSVVEEESAGNGGRPCFVLSCAVCFWDSREIAWEFEKATGIPAQIERIKAAKAPAREYAGLLDYWRTVQRTAATVPGTQRAGAGFSAGGTSSFGSRIASTALQGSSKATCVDDLPAYKSPSHAEAGHLQAAAASEPQRIRLHMKLSRRCRVCHHILTKPESKAQATRFKIQLMAVNFVPAITIPVGLAGQTVARLSGPFRVGAAVPLVVRFANPLYTKMDVAVAAGTDAAAHVRVLAPRFTLAPFAELWEYDEEDEEDKESDGGDDDAGGGGRGVVHRHGSRVAIQLELTPRSPTDSLAVPLHITCSHVDDMADVDAEDNGSSSRNSGAGTSRNLVTSSFWVQVLLGPVH
ncbi:hypothetical protein H4R19_000672 [Coemansia spiralis]|nr:hypothetical protein H4R19_000672 [Coemansia spiralis]